MKSLAAVIFLLLSTLAAEAQTFTVNSLQATPSSVKPGQTIVFSTAITSNQNASNYPLGFWWKIGSSSSDTGQNVSFLTFSAGVPLNHTYSWTVPTGTPPGSYVLTVSVYDPSWQSKLGTASVPFTITTTTSALPVDLQTPVISGTAQVGKVLTSSTGSWSNATSYGYQWKRGSTTITGATTASYTLVSNDAGSDLTATVTATGPGGSASATSAPVGPIVSGTSTATTSGSFTALHTYYISPTGNDANSGTSSSAPWATANHAVKCGDVIIAAAGSYTKGQFGTNTWGTVSNCPSTSGGIDGKGGVYFATVLCAGPTLGSCTVNGGNYEAFRVDQSNWAVEGFSATQSSTGNGSCYSATSETSATLHHIAFINDIASNCDYSGFDSYSWHGTTGSVDYNAVVGAIAYNAAPSTGGGGICGSGVSLIPTVYDTNPGTHIFVAGYFGYHNINAPSGAGCNTDGEGLIFDSWGNYTYSQQAVAEQNVFWDNGSAGFEAFPQGNGTTSDQATVIFFNNTSYGNDQDPLNQGGGGELFLNQIYPRVGVNSYTFTNNIFEATVSKPGGSGSGKVYGASINCLNGCPNPPVSINGNYIWNTASPTTVTGGNNTYAWYGGANQGANWIWGANTYNNPGLANPGALPTTAPNCASYHTTTDCMAGMNVVADITPSGGAVGKGYQPPGACTADPYYPTWLKGVVYLAWNGSALTENSGLITKPCNI